MGFGTSIGLIVALSRVATSGADAREDALVVRVVNAQQAPLGDMAVDFGLVHRDGRSEVVATKRTRWGSGAARFDDWLDAVIAADDATPFVRLATPFGCDRFAWIERDDPQQGPIELVAPESGTAILEFGDDVAGSVQIRVTQSAKSTAPASNPVEFPIVDGRVVLPQVALEATFDLEALFDGEEKTRSGAFTAPDSSSSTVHCWPLDRSLAPKVRGRLVDEEGRPLPIEEVRCTWDGDEPIDDDLAAEIDPAPVDDGRFEAIVAVTRSNDGKRRLELVAYRDEVPVHAVVDVVGPIGREPKDLGDVMMVVRGSRRWMRKLSDEQLAREFEARWNHFGFDERDCEACLLEMAERGTELLRTRLEAWLATAETTSYEVSDLERGRPSAATLLTALRRAERKPEPLALEFAEPPPTHAALLPVPRLALRLRNVDAARRTIPLVDERRDPAGIFPTIDVAIFDAEGRRVRRKIERDGFPEFEWFEERVRGTRKALRAGEDLPLEMVLGRYAELPGPGSYRVEIAWSGSLFPGSMSSLDGLVLTKGPAFPITLDPLRLHMKRSELVHLEALVREIDVDGRPPPFVRGPWKTPPESDEPPTRPEDVLYRAGLRALPALLDLVDAKDFGDERFAWIVALLTDITGLRRTSVEAPDRFLRDATWFDEWPTSAALERLERTGSPDDSESRYEMVMEQIGMSSRQESARRWVVLRSWIDLELEE